MTIWRTLLVLVTITVSSLALAEQGESVPGPPGEAVTEKDMQPTSEEVEAALKLAEQEKNNDPQRASKAKPTPPLSVYDSLSLLGNVQEILRDPRHFDAAQNESVGETLEAVRGYLIRLNESNPTLPYYEWQKLEQAEISRTEWHRVVYGFDDPLEDVTALLLRARDDDIEVRRVVVHEADGRQWPFNATILLRDRQPRREVLHLPLPTKIERIEFECRWVRSEGGEQPSLSVRSGVCDRPEHLKRAVYFLQRAELALKKDDESISLPAIRKDLDRTIKEVQAFRTQKP